MKSISEAGDSENSDIFLIHHWNMIKTSHRSANFPRERVVQKGKSPVEQHSDFISSSAHLAGGLSWRWAGWLVALGINNHVCIITDHLCHSSLYAIRANRGIFGKNFLTLGLFWCQTNTMAAAVAAVILWSNSLARCRDWRWHKVCNLKWCICHVHMKLAVKCMSGVLSRVDFKVASQPKRLLLCCVRLDASFTWQSKTLANGFTMSRNERKSNTTVWIWLCSIRNGMGFLGPANVEII